MRVEFNCHSGTSKKEVLDFIARYPTNLILIHYEGNMQPTWGDDHEAMFKLPNDLDRAVNLIETHYIHNVYVTD